LNSIAVGAGDARVVETGSKGDVLQGWGRLWREDGNLGARTLVQSLYSRQRVAGGCRHDLVVRGEGVSEGGPANGKQSQQREGQKELEKGAKPIRSPRDQYKK
jgi:hypothetical protein